MKKHTNHISGRWLKTFTRSEGQSESLKKKFDEGNLKDRRENKRHEINHKLVFSVLGPDTSVPMMEGYGHTINTSLSGLCFVASEKVECPKMLQIDIQFHEPPYHTIILSESLRCIEDPDIGVYHIGVKFLNGVSSELAEML